MSIVRSMWNWMDPRKSAVGGIAFIALLLLGLILIMPVMLWLLGFVWVPFDAFVQAWWDYWLQ